MYLLQENVFNGAGGGGYLERKIYEIIFLFQF